MTRPLRILAAVAVTLGLALPYNYSVSPASARAAETASNSAMEATFAEAVVVIRAKRAHAKQLRIARNREISRMVMPTYGQLSAHFGQTSYLWSARHTGMDIDARSGTTVRNMMKGRLIFAGWAGAYGNLVVIRTFKGGDIWYAHLQSIRKRHYGAVVKSGRTIGWVGSTGHTTGSHLHLEVRKNDYPINPADFIWGKNRGKIDKMKIPSWAYGSRVEHLSDL